MVKKLLQNQNLPALLLRLGLAATLLYAAVSGFVSPKDWVGYLPDALTDRLSPELVLNTFSVGELLLVAWLLSGIYVRYAALLTAIMMTGIVLSTLDLLIVSFRDIGLAFAALALAALPENKR